MPLSLLDDLVALAGEASKGSSFREIFRITRVAMRGGSVDNCHLVADAHTRTHTHSVSAGARAIDLGCGPAGVVALLAERVGSGGHVVGVDADPEHIALARAFAAQQGLQNLEILQADARHTGLPAGTFDVVHARYLLVNIPRPEEVVVEMARLAKPGGWVVGAEVDITPLICHPPQAEWDQMGRLLITSFQHDGANPHVGRTLAEMFREAGLVEVGVEIRADTYPHGGPCCRT